MADDRKQPRRNWWMPDDDLVEGLDREGRPPGLRAFFATTIAASLLIWDVTFALGAYHTIFYSTLFKIVVASTVLLLGSVMLRRVIHVRPWTRAVLAIPLLWLLARWIAPFGRSTDSQHALEYVLVGLSLASVPFTLWALARVMAPDYFALPNRTLKTASVVIVTAVAVIGFLVGQFNYDFTTCHDYVIAGDDEPAHCAQSR